MNALKKPKFIGEKVKEHSISFQNKPTKNRQNKLAPRENMNMNSHKNL